MERREFENEARQACEHVLGYLNFSSGAPDPSVMSSLDVVFEVLVDEASSETPVWVKVGRVLREQLERLEAESSTFRDSSQARAVLRLVFEETLPAYHEFHRELLFHQTTDNLFRPFFVGCVCEAVLAQGPPWEDSSRIVGRSISSLNDYIGHRPVAVLETQKLEPYPHEWLRPVPIYVQGAGVSTGKCQRVVQRAIEFLRDAPEEILRPAYFHLEQMEELAFDPRAYDFDHPVNKRPNYHFGQWDPHRIDNQGRYRRFIVQEVTLNALMLRLEQEGKIPQEELEYEAAAVLAGTILMASGTSGSGPGCFDSTTTLSDLLPPIASYRDAFYEHLMAQTSGAHARRLERESNQKHQPFGGARQHLNAELARRRASQLEHVHLARVFAAMGYPEAAARQAAVVPVASARMLCQLDCSLTEGAKMLQRGELGKCADLLPEVVQLLRRAIQCGAVVDPWNLLGFDAQFSLFPAMENSIFDHRVEELLLLMERIFSLYSSAWSEAAAVDDGALCARIDHEFRELSDWWRQYAAHECASISCPDSHETYEASRLVATALGMWHRGGALAGDVAFWAPHAELFPSPEAYTLVIDALLARRDFVAAMALLMHWLSQAPRMPLIQGESSFYQLAIRWLTELPSTEPSGESIPSERRWGLAQKFFDFLEANADAYWMAPQFQLKSTGGTDAGLGLVGDFDDEPEEEEDLFGAAYDNVVYRDETDDGVEGPIYDPGSDSEDEFENEAKRLMEHLAFLRCVAKLWKIAAIGEPFSAATDPEGVARHDALRRWSLHAADNRQGLLDLLDSVRRYRLPSPNGDHESMLEYDRRRMAKDSLLEQIITTGVEVVDASRLLQAAAFSPALLLEQMQEQKGDDDECEAVCLLSAILHRDRDWVRERWETFEKAFGSQPLLYVPVTKGGDPQTILNTRVRQKVIQDLLTWLPRSGLLVEACRLIELARAMERNHSVGPGAVTEFDELYTLGYKSLVETVVASFAHWSHLPKSGGKRAREGVLVSCLEKLTESLLVSWLAHSQTLRLSYLEFMYDDEAFDEIVRFIRRYGADLFTQKFLNLGNIRAILHEGVEVWLDQLQENHRVQLRLLEELDSEIPRKQAVRQLSLVLEAIMENYGEYRDYNSTTTQSDRGELLYILLDFLRLQSRYDRICWNLRPVILAHEILARRGCNDAARIWRRELTDRIREKASEFIKELRQLQRQHAIRMPTVADRVSERFIQPLTIDRVKALVEPAIEQADRGGSQKAFTLLERETDSLTRVPTGAGLDVPDWLEALEEEVERLRRPLHARTDDESLRELLPQTLLSYDETMAQLKQWAEEVSKKGKDALRFRI
jgi:hypothetical protein